MDFKILLVWFRLANVAKPTGVIVTWPWENVGCKPGTQPRPDVFSRYVMVRCCGNERKRPISLFFLSVFLLMTALLAWKTTPFCCFEGGFQCPRHKKHPLVLSTPYSLVHFGWSWLAAFAERYYFFKDLIMRSRRTQTQNAYFFIYFVLCSCVLFKLTVQGKDQNCK